MVLNVLTVIPNTDLMQNKSKCQNIYCDLIDGVVFCRHILFRQGDIHLYMTIVSYNYIWKAEGPYNDTF